MGEYAPDPGQSKILISTYCRADVARLFEPSIDDATNAIIGIANGAQCMVTVRESPCTDCVAVILSFFPECRKFIPSADSQRIRM